MNNDSSPKAQHTPGRWTVGKHRSEGGMTPIEAPRNDGTSFTSYFVGYVQSTEIAGEEEANAALFASAPELLEALQDMLADACGQPKSCGHDFECICTGDKARAAIASATGGAA